MIEPKTEPKTLRDEIAAGLQTFARKGVKKLNTDSAQYHHLFKQLCTLDSDEPLKIALYCFFKYYQWNYKDRKLETSAFLGRLLNISLSLLDDNSRHKLRGLLLQMSEDKQDKMALPDKDKRVKYLIKYLNAMELTMSEDTRSKIKPFEKLFTELLTPPPLLGKQKHKENQAAIIEALKALFRDDTNLLSLVVRNCSEEAQIHFVALEPKAATPVDPIILDVVPRSHLYRDLINPRSTFIRALEDYYSTRRVLGGDVVIVGEQVHARIEFQELAGVLARIGKTNPVGMLNCILVIINIFLENPDNNSYINDKLKSSGLLGRLLNASSHLIMSTNQRYEFEQLKARSRHWTGDDDKALKQTDARTKYLKQLRTAIVDTLGLWPNEVATEESILESGCPELTVLFENAIVKNRTSPDHAQRRAHIFAAIESFFALKADPENGEKMEAFTSRKNACTGEDKVQLTDLTRQLPEKAKATVIGSAPGTPVSRQRERGRVVRAGSGADDGAIPAAILEKAEQQKRDETGRNAFIALRASGRGNGPLGSAPAVSPATSETNSPAVARVGMGLSRKSEKK